MSYETVVKKDIGCRDKLMNDKEVLDEKVVDFISYVWNTVKGISYNPKCKCGYPNGAEFSDIIHRMLGSQYAFYLEERIARGFASTNSSNDRITIIDTAQQEKLMYMEGRMDDGYTVYKDQRFIHEKRHPDLLADDEWVLNFLPDLFYYEGSIYFKGSFVGKIHDRRQYFFGEHGSLYAITDEGFTKISSTGKKLWVTPLEKAWTYYFLNDFGAFQFFLDKTISLTDCSGTIQIYRRKTGTLAYTKYIREQNSDGGIKIGQEDKWGEIANPDPGKDEIDYITQSLEAYNKNNSTPEDYREICFIEYNKDHKPVGGITASMSMEWLCIKVLWVEEKYRRKGIGKKLVKEAENCASAAGIRNAYVNVYRFQTPDFFKKLNYNYTVLEKIDRWLYRGDIMHFVKRLA